jgi:hypothetical protein
LQVLRGNARRSISQSDNDEVLWMKSPVVLVTVALTVAILLAASFLIATGTRGDNAFARNPAQTMPTSPAAKVKAKCNASRARPRLTTICEK